MVHLVTYPGFYDLLKYNFALYFWMLCFHYRHWGVCAYCDNASIPCQNYQKTHLALVDLEVCPAEARAAELGHPAGPGPALAPAALAPGHLGAGQRYRTPRQAPASSPP